MRVAVTSDLHYDSAGDLTPPAAIEELARRIAAERPDAVILAGDLAHGLDQFAACVRCFRDVGAPFAVLAGNHDVWRDDARGLGSQRLFDEALPAATRAEGAIWLEGETVRVGDVAIVGSLAWYDYSAVDPGVHAPPDVVGALKGRFNNDAHWIDWPDDDRAVAARLGAAMRARLRAACDDPSVRAVLVATHVPILEEQMVRRPEDPRWGFSNAYFGNLTLGAAVLGEPKVRAVVSGHTHFGRRAQVARAGAPPIDAAVVGSDYGAPELLSIEI